MFSTIGGNFFWYIDGAQLAAKFLGFSDMHHLTGWATEHVGVWGNENGLAMFLDAKAFDGKANTCNDLADHWDGVADRIEEVNQNE